MRPALNIPLAMCLCRARLWGLPFQVESFKLTKKSSKGRTAYFQTNQIAACPEKTRPNDNECALIFGNAVMLLFATDYMVTLVQPTFKTCNVTFWLFGKAN